MEELTKQQMVLLTLLVSFVASIATSVSVVSLLNETPMTITQTVNRIVEKTIEKVVPAQMAQMLPTPPTPKEVPAASESDSIIGAVEANLLKMVTVWSGKTAVEEGVEHGIGFAVSSDGLAVTDKNILGEGADYSVVFPGGKTYKAVKAYTDENSGIAILQLRDDKDQNATGTPSVSFASSEPKLGSPVAALGGKEGATVYQGIVSEKTKGHIITSIPFKQIDRGGILFGTDGKVLGMNSVAMDEEKYTISAASILSAIANYRKDGTAQKTPQ
jgi:S1-C subfamily serine protease